MSVKRQIMITDTPWIHPAGGDFGTNSAVDIVRRNGKQSGWVCRLMSHSGVFLLLLLMGMGSHDSSMAAEVALTKSGELTVVGMGGAEAEVVIDYFSGDVIRNAAAALVQEIRRRTGVALPIRCGEPTPGKVAIYLGNFDRNALLTKALASLGLQPVTADSPGNEGFLLASGRKDDEAGIVVVNGCDDLGTFHGVGWLLRKMRFPEGRALVPVGLNISTAPAAWQRRMIFESNAGYSSTDTAPLGPRAGGQLSVPIIHKSYFNEFGKGFKLNCYNPRELDPACAIWEPYTVQ